MKSGYIAAKKQGSDGRWIVRFDRANPKEGQSKSWYVKLLKDDPEPFVSDTRLIRVDEDLLKQLEPLGGCDYFEHVYEETKKSNRTFVPTDPDRPSIELDNKPTFTPAPISDYSAAIIVDRSWKMASEFASYGKEKEVFTKIKEDIQFAMASEVCNLMNKCELGDPDLFSKKST